MKKIGNFFALPFGFSTFLPSLVLALFCLLYAIARMPLAHHDATFWWSTVTPNFISFLIGTIGFINGCYALFGGVVYLLSKFGKKSKLAKVQYQTIIKRALIALLISIIAFTLFDHSHSLLSFLRHH